MTTSNSTFTIHPSIVISNDNNSAKEVSICHASITKEGEKWNFCTKKIGSLHDLRQILTGLIDGFNKGCEFQYEYQLSDYPEHLWYSLKEFQDEYSLADYNKVAVFCCPLSYLKEHYNRKPNGSSIMKFIYRVESEELTQHAELRTLYDDIIDTEVREEENIIIYSALEFAAKRWFKMVNDMKLSSIQGSTAKSLSQRGTF